MSFPQTVYFSISNFWYKLTQPKLYSTYMYKWLNFESFTVRVSVLWIFEISKILKIDSAQDLKFSWQESDFL